MRAPKAIAVAVTTALLSALAVPAALGLATASPGWAEVVRPRPAPNRPPLAPLPEAAAAPTPTVAAPADAARDVNRGPVTNLPLPRYVTLKGKEGNARRGPGRTHRIDWVFTRPGMPLRVTAEYENWRRVEDAEGMGGWVHYTLLSGTRAVIVLADMTPFHSLPDARSGVVLQAEQGVIARVLQCEPDWCRLLVDGQRGWVPKSVLWGVEPGEVVD